MRLFSVRRLAVATLLPALFLFCAVPGCANEGEGQRCGDDPYDPSQPGSPNNDDCESGLICVSASALINNQANRCCNSNANVVNDSRCLRASGTANEGGSGGTAANGGTAGAAGSGGTAASGAGGLSGSAGTGGSAGADTSSSAEAGAGGN